MGSPKDKPLSLGSGGGVSYNLKYHFNPDSFQGTSSSVQNLATRFSGSPAMGQILVSLSQGQPGSGLENAGRALQSILQTQGKIPLRKAFQALSQGHQSQLVEQWGRNGLAQLFSISEIRNPRIFSHALLNLARRSFQNGESGTAALIWQGMAEVPGWLGLKFSDLHQEQARADWRALQGEGPLGRRLQLKAQGFVEAVFAPGPLLGFALGAPIYSSVRGAMLGRLFGRSPSFWTRGIGARMAASSVALPGEVFAFWGANLAVQAYTETPLPPGHSTSDELLSLGLTFSLFKIFGYGAQRGLSSYWQSRAAGSSLGVLAAPPKYLNATANTLGMYGGLVTAHALEQKLELRPAGGDLMFESLISLVQLKMMGAVSHRLMGPRYAAWMQGLEGKVLQQEAAAQWRDSNPQGPGWLEGLSQVFSPPQVLMTPEGIPMLSWVRRPGDSRAQDHISMMSGDGPGGSSKSSTPPAATRPSSRPPRELSSRPENLSPLRAILSEFMDNSVDGAKRGQAGCELYEHLPQVKELLRERWERAQETASSLEKPGQKDHQTLEQSVRLGVHKITIAHFTALSDRIHRQIVQFDYFLSELRAKSDQGSRAERQARTRLISSVELKEIELMRHHHEAESYMGDYKGPYKRSVLMRGVMKGSEPAMMII